ncbi:MAG: hydantoinase/oxoprolinase family protein [Tepidanaerobacteraceae bacterium]|nr:hydantoinase/oxoprolinase family protein [Thermoanaerobacterales bacterium]
MIIGLDMGGTNVDAVLLHDGEIIEAIKSPTDYTNLLDSVWEPLRLLISKARASQIKRIILSTTISTNAIIEQKIDPVGMIIQCGPGLQKDFLCCGKKNVFISGYIDHRGKEISPLDTREIEQVVKDFKEEGISAVSVTGKFSVRNGKHEINIYNMLKDRFHPITLGHTLSGKLNFPRRVFTSFYNSAVSSTFHRFSENILKALKREKIYVPIFILKADGGTMSLEFGNKQPVQTILSGPAASVMGGQAFLSTNKDAVFLDIGGTTTDISFLANGVPLFEPLGIKIGAFPTLVRALYSASIGVGGDSQVSIKDNKILIGPKRQGPPRALGGLSVTPTDAMIFLGTINAGDRHKAIAAMEEIGDQLGIDPRTAANLILDTMVDMIKDKVDDLLKKINSRPVYTVKELLYGKKVLPELIQVIGGPAQAMAPILREKFNIPCLYPKNYQLANAVGSALAKNTLEISMFVDTVSGRLSVPELGLFETVHKTYSLEEARKYALNLINEMTLLGEKPDESEAEIIEENSFNMVRGFSTSGKNMRIRAQTKPGLIYELRSDKNVIC